MVLLCFLLSLIWCASYPEVDGAHRQTPLRICNLGERHELADREAHCVVPTAPQAPGAPAHDAEVETFSRHCPHQTGQAFFQQVHSVPRRNECDPARTVPARAGRDRETRLRPGICGPKPTDRFGQASTPGSLHDRADDRTRAATVALRPTALSLEPRRHPFDRRANYWPPRLAEGLPPKS